MTVYRLLALASLTSLLLVPAAPLSAAEGTAMPTRVVLEGVDRYRVPEPLFEGVRIILSHRGESHSSAYIQGLSGAAFRLGGPCPCAPTCEYAMVPGDLLSLLGYESERVEFDGETEPAHQLPRVLARIKEEIRAGRPVLVWNALTTAEFDVVCGFDEDKHELIGRGSYRGLEGYASANESRPADHKVAPVIGAILIGRKVRSFDARAAEIAALREALLHAHGASASIFPGMPAGLACYDVWIASYQNRGMLVRAKSRDGAQDLGWVAAQSGDDFYPLTIWPGTRQAAADFLREIAPRYPEAATRLETAADHFAQESRALAACRDVLGDRSEPPSADQSLRAAGHLRVARAMYQLGIEDIARALRAIGPAKQGKL